MRAVGSAARISMASRLAIAQHWRRQRDKTVWEVIQLHRRERLAELRRSSEDGIERLNVGFSELARKWEQVN